MRVAVELTEEQLKALSKSQNDPPRLVNPHTHEAFVLLPVDQYAKLTETVYDDSPLSREELEAVAWQTADRAGWDAEDDETVEQR